MVNTSSGTKYGTAWEQGGLELRILKKEKLPRYDRGNQIIGLRQRWGIKGVGPKHRDARFIYGERRGWQRRKAKGKHWQEEFT